MSPEPLSDLLDKGVRFWLESYAADGVRLPDADAHASAVFTVSDAALPALRETCANWDLTLEQAPTGPVVASGRQLPVRALAATIEGLRQGRAFTLAPGAELT